MKRAAARSWSSGSQIAFAATCFVVALLSTDASAHTCGARPWQYNANDLAEARRRLNSPAIQTLNTRVDCAETIIRTPGLAGPFPECTECAVEYVGLLADSATYMRRAAEEAGVTARSIKAYLMKEQSTRQRLHDFLSGADQAGIRDRYYNGNLLALADAMERVGMASEYHQLVSALSEESKLQLQMYRVWVKAVRSCAVWDFKSANDLTLLKKSLCNSDCIEDLRAVYSALQRADLVRPDGKVKTSLPAMPVPAECQLASDSR
jgi:hypothetical protein